MNGENAKPSNAEVLFGNEGGSPAESGNIETALRGTFEPLEHQARYDGKAGLAASIAGVSKTLGGNMLEMGFSEASAREVANLFKEYHASPREAAEAEKNLHAAMEELADEWDVEYNQRFEGATQTLAALTKGNPALLDFVHSTGLSRDARFLRLLGNIAKGRKAKK